MIINYNCCIKLVPLVIVILKIEFSFHLTDDTHCEHYKHKFVVV